MPIYVEHYTDYFGGQWDDPRALLWVQKVIGSDGIQRFMSVPDVQACQAGFTVTACKLQKQ